MVRFARPRAYAFERTVPARSGYFQDGTLAVLAPTSSVPRGEPPLQRRLIVRPAPGDPPINSSIEKRLGCFGRTVRWRAFGGARSADVSTRLLRSELFELPISAELRIASASSNVDNEPGF